MTQTEPVPARDENLAAGTDWTGRTVRGRDGSRLGTLVEVRPGDGSSPSGWGVVRSTFGKRRLVPLDGATDGDDGLTVAADRASVRTAPVADGEPGAPALCGSTTRAVACSPTPARCSTSATAASSWARRSSAGSSPSA